VEQSKEAEARSQRSLKVLETLAEAVGHCDDPFNIPPLMLSDIRSFEKYVSETLVEYIVGIYKISHSIRLLLEIRTALEPPEQGRTSRLFRLNRRGNGLDDSDERLSDLQQKFEASSQRSASGSDTSSVSAGALSVPPDPCSHTLEPKPFSPRFSGLKSRLDPVSSTCADVASTTLKVLEKPGSSVPLLNGVVGGVSALLDTAKVQQYFPCR
jgi:hypothetical protein